MINKIGTPESVVVGKTSSFVVDPNLLAAWIAQKIETKEVSVADLHDVLKGMGISDYESADMDALIVSLSAVGVVVVR